ncbi:hypothetical protein WJX81_002903 [Elliptochloris bilobata]|uniref:Proteasome assembly chaperone 3 n=1 Tax=Elliptochloris bilobata TaxID=381761 RepID=A0AAW1S908_9CHLO
MAEAFPLRTQQFEATIAGVTTSFLLTAYADRILVVATQLGTLGTVLQARAEAALDSPASYSVDALLGRRGEPALDLAARRLAEELAAAGCRRPLLLCLGLREHSLAVVRPLVEAVLSHPVW